MSNIFATGKDQKGSMVSQDIVLLENDGTLPLQRDQHKIIVYENGTQTDKTADIAVYVISRPSGVKLTPADYELSEQETHDLEIVTAAYPKTVVILNMDGVVDTKHLRDHVGICAVLLVRPARIISAQGLDDILTGKTVPSGRLSVTWAENYEDYPANQAFGYFSGDITNEKEKDNISVGYRYFDTFGIKPAYPFGFGRSYTSFSVASDCVMISGRNVVVHASVTNIGIRHSGSEMLQVYYSAPAGKRMKPYQELAGFAWTKELAPGETERVTVSFPLASMASCDEERMANVLEEGLYYIRVGNHSRNTHIAAALSIDSEVMICRCSNESIPDIDYTELPSRLVGTYTYEGETREKEAAVVIDVITSTL